MRSLRIVAAAAALAITGSTAALAADLGSIKDPPMMTVAPGYSWSGVYGGIHIGGAWGDADLTERLPNFFAILPPSLSSGHDVDGWLGGLQLGMNRQFGKVVLGVDLSLSGADISGSNGDCFGLTTLAGGLATVRCDTKVNWLASAMFKVGYAMDRWLVYGKVGWAVAGIDHKLTGTIIPIPISVASSVNETADGIAFGAGVEYAFGNGISLGLEYTHMNLEADGSGLILGGILTTGSREVDLDIVRMRLNFKLGQ